MKVRLKLVTGRVLTGLTWPHFMCARNIRASARQLTASFITIGGWLFFLFVPLFDTIRVLPVFCLRKLAKGRVAEIPHVDALLTWHYHLLTVHIDDHVIPSVLV